MNLKFHYKLICLTFFFTLLNTSGIKSQNNSSSYQVSGRVIDKSGSSPVEFANVILYNVKDSTPAGYTVTNISGGFNIPCKDTGDYFISVTYMGYKKHDTNAFKLSAERKSVTLPDIIFEEDEQMLSEVVVTGQIGRASCRERV